jgi:uncharacterized repeat protein (TIGR04138 family)
MDASGTLAGCIPFLRSPGVSRRSVALPPAPFRHTSGVSEVNPRASVFSRGIASLLSGGKNFATVLSTVAKPEILKELETLCERDKRYELGAYVAVMMGFKKIHDRNEKLTGEPGRVSALELCRALRDHFILFHGHKALEMMRSFGIKTSDDVGEMVEVLAANDLLEFGKGDSREDFTDMFDFEREFEKWQHARWGVWWGFAVVLLALPMLVFAGWELWRALSR